MPRYIKRPKAYDGWNNGPMIANIQVPLREPTDTGLLDSDGNTIWRVNDPIGFQF